MVNKNKTQDKKSLDLIRLSRAATILFSIAPIFWLPSINQQLLSISKTLAALFCLLAFFLCSPKASRAVKNNRTTTLAIALLAASLAYTSVFYNGSSLGPLALTLYIVFFFLIGNTLGTYNAPLIRIDYHTIPFILLFIALCAWVATATISPSFDTPNPLYNEIATTTDYIHFQQPYLSSTGFNGGRTGWSISVFLFVLCLVNATQDRSNTFQKAIANSALAIGMTSILTTGSRGGLLYLFVYATLFVFIGPRHLSLTFKALAAILLLFTVSIAYFAFGDVLRLSGVDDFSTGRIEGYSISIVILAQNLLWGAYPHGGYTLIESGLQYDQIHNAWLNFVAMYGLAFSCIFFFFFLTALTRAFAASRGKFHLQCLLIAGVLSTFLEPQTIFSNGHHILIYWGVLGYLNSKNTSSQSRQRTSDVE